MELREPPRSTHSRGDGSAIRRLLWINLLLLAGLLAVVVLRTSGQGDGQSAAAETSRQVAAKLQAAGVLDEAAARYEDYLRVADPPPDKRARIAYSLGTNYLQSGRYDVALRWFYEAETLGVEDLADELAARIVHCLERLGRHHSAQAAVEGRVQLAPESARRAEEDAVVARIGETEIFRSELLRALDDLPPELADDFATPAGRKELLEKYVADELLWRKAVKLEFDRDPEVARRHAQALKQLTVARFVEREVLGRIEVDEADLRNYFEANRGRYSAASAGGEEDSAAPVPFEQARPLVERDYRLLKIQSAYDDLIESELATQDVELFPERLDGEG